MPTSVVRGPDGALYVSQLTGFPFEQGAANIYRIDRRGARTVFASGLTNVTDLAFAEDGSLYAVQISAAGLLNPGLPIGSLVKVTPGAERPRDHRRRAGRALRAWPSTTTLPTSARVPSASAVAR